MNCKIQLSVKVYVQRRCSEVGHSVKVQFNTQGFPRPASVRRGGGGSAGRLAGGRTGVRACGTV